MHHVLGLQESLRQLQAQGKTLLMVLHDVRDVADCAEEVVLLGKQKLHLANSLEKLVESGIVQDVYGVSITRHEQYSFERMRDDQV